MGSIRPMSLSTKNRMEARWAQDRYPWKQKLNMRSTILMVIMSYGAYCQVKFKFPTLVIHEMSCQISPFFMRLNSIFFSSFNSRSNTAIQMAKTLGLMSKGWRYKGLCRGGTYLSGWVNLSFCMFSRLQLFRYNDGRGLGGLQCVHQLLVIQ